MTAVMAPREVAQNEDSNGAQDAGFLGPFATADFVASSVVRGAR